MPRLWWLFSLLILATCPALADSPTLRVHAPPQVTAHRSFSVTVENATRQDLDNDMVTLRLVTDGAQPISLEAAPAVMVGGRAVFPAVMLSGQGQVQLLAEVTRPGQIVSGLSAPIELVSAGPVGTPTITLEPAIIPGQYSHVPFQVTAHVVDAQGAPIAGALVALRTDPAYGEQTLHVPVMFIPVTVHGSTVLFDASGQSVPQVDGTTDANGTVQIWLRLDNKIAPFDARLLPTVTVPGQTVAGTPSNVFKVDRILNDNN